MNTRFFLNFTNRLACISAGLFLGLCAVAVAAAEKTNPTTASAHGAAGADAKPAPIEVPLSQFTIPSTLAEGRNPFFPDSTATLKTPSKVDTNQQGKVVSYALVLQGISGTGTKRFALINGRTFEVNEDGDVSMGRAKVHVHCISIRDDSVVVDVEGNRQELKLRPGL